jgi:nitrite reductase/ring-hydroxylating ferredoxin subunit
MKEVQVKGESVCIANVEGKFYAICNICTHEGGPLADGTLDGYEVECPWHNSRFDVRTGDVKSPPAGEPELVYEVKIEGSNILIKLQDKSKSITQFELELVEKIKVEGTDVMSFKFSKQDKEIESSQQTRLSDYKAGQFAFFEIICSIFDLDNWNFCLCNLIYRSLMELYVSI